ncbi:nuclear transport factor 2 family protein [bacterium]|nr:MAG: nuclear transport factor 2 family protein [bacterium]
MPDRSRRGVQSFMRSVALLALLLPVFAPAQTSDPKAFFEDTYKKLSDYTLKKDMTAMEKQLKAICAPDFAFYSSGGKKQNGKQLISSMKLQMKQVGKITKSTSKLDKIVIKGDQAVLTVSSQYAMDIPMGGDKPGKLVGSNVTFDTWINTPKGWKLKEIKTGKETATLNGKALPTQ